MFMMEPMWNLSMHAFVFDDNTFKIRLNIDYTVRLEIRQYQSQIRLAGLVAVTEWRTQQYSKDRRSSAGTRASRR